MQQTTTRLKTTINPTQNQALLPISRPTTGGPKSPLGRTHPVIPPISQPQTRSRQESYIEGVEIGYVKDSNASAVHKENSNQEFDLKLQTLFQRPNTKEKNVNSELVYDNLISSSLSHSPRYAVARKDSDIQNVFSNNSDMNKGPQFYLPTILPTFKTKSINARSIDLKWIFQDSENSRNNIKIPEYGEILYQLTKTEMDNPSFEIAYEGLNSEVKIDGLAPYTRYLFKLRMKPNQSDIEYDWSRQFAQFECTTTDESQFQKVSAQLVRAIQDSSANIS
ncbi:hypothetical protein HK096_002415, partial [Nowakowskiella sp. JEL0078]